MSVYLDDAMIPWRGKRWCHLYADSLPELEAFARRVGLKPEWLQHPDGEGGLPHYDVTGTMLDRCKTEGAVEVTRGNDPYVRLRRALGKGEYIMVESRNHPVKVNGHIEWLTKKEYDANMSDNYGKTKSGEQITDEMIERLAAEAERGYDVNATFKRRVDPDRENERLKADLEVARASLYEVVAQRNMLAEEVKRLLDERGEATGHSPRD